MITGAAAAGPPPKFYGTRDNLVFGSTHAAHQYLGGDTIP